MLINKNSKNAAFTLIELILSIAVLGIVGVVLSTMLIEAIKSYQLVSSRRESLTEIKLAIERMKQEINLITSQNNIDSIGDTNFQFDLPPDADINYFLDGNNLMRKNDILASNVNSLDFDFLDSNGNQTATIANIQRIRIEIVIQSPNNEGVQRIRTQIFPRNFYYDGFE
jgi:prepilin-type N-terminal cleavage/methylation domain-containing protein